MKIAFLTLGCKVNSYETDKMKLQFEDAGHMVVSFEEKADIYVVNTCTVTNIADRKSRKMLHRAKRMNENALTVATGCYVDSAVRKGEYDESIDLFVSNKDKERIVDIVITELKKREFDFMPEENDDILQPMSEAALSEEHTRAYIKIQNGCNQYCTYCIIPYVRGQLSSRSIEDVCSEVTQLAARGYKEIVITGIHVSSYGVTENKTDAFLKLEGKPLLELLEAVSHIDGIERIRLGSLEPRIITEEFAERLSHVKGICPHFHLSLQSGCDTVLKRMNRHYGAEEYLDRLAILRKYFREPAITTDIIVGFPQETQEEFEITCEFVRKARFAQLHVFKYSRRYGTIADRMEGQITEKEKSVRSEKLISIGKDMEKIYRQASVLPQEKVLVEEIIDIDGRKYAVGYNERYVRFGMPADEFQVQGQDIINNIVCFDTQKAKIL